MFNLQGSEIIVILLIALVVLGPERLPDAVRRFMQTYHELKKMGNGFQSEIKAAFDEPMREIRDTAQMVRDAADPSKLMAESDAEQRLRQDVDATVTPEPVLPPPVAAEQVSSNGAAAPPSALSSQSPPPPPPPLPPPPPPPHPSPTTSPSTVAPGADEQVADVAAAGDNART